MTTDTNPERARWPFVESPSTNPERALQNLVDAALALNMAWNHDEPVTQFAERLDLVRRLAVDGRAALASRAVPQPHAKALESAEHMAKSAEQFIEAVNRFGNAMTEEEEEEVGRAEDDIVEFAFGRGLRSDIYEFRKHAAIAARDVPQPHYEQMRLALVGQIHELLDIAERHAWTTDPDEKRRTEGAIAYARKVTAQYNCNGSRAALGARAVPQPLTEAKIWALAPGHYHPIDFARAIERAHGIGDLAIDAAKEGKQ